MVLLNTAEDDIANKSATGVCVACYNRLICPIVDLSC